MSFIDQIHINQVRDALWRFPESHASVMIGSGFSRNAREIGLDSHNFPLWNDISELICQRLYGDNEHITHALTEAASTSGFLRLAQEYEVAFGRKSLHNLIREITPDNEHVPDHIHIRMLNLPWRDIFTTNWDTLLERTRQYVVDRTYSVVRTPEEIPMTTRPKIVKLHGSLPANVPFIFTEEDYRTYPSRFAPFVNMVQQAMMESMVLLIGFSGDDPNFLHWSGWVRDNLGEYAPKIYLAGWLHLSSQRRRMLEFRNVVPIDLAYHPKASDWPEHLRHQYATEWILHTLEHGKPYDVTEWPNIHERNIVEVPEVLHPIEDISRNVPLREPNPPVTNRNQNDISEHVRNIVNNWSHNRKIYPGWLFFPINKLFLFDNTKRWENYILNALPEFSMQERLWIVWELVWRLERMLEPLSDTLTATVQTILDEIDCQKRQLAGAVDYTAEWKDIRVAWRDLMMALLTAARQNFDRPLFDSRIEALQPFLNDHPDVLQKICHEKCLWALYSLDFPTLEQLLKEWCPEKCDPIWMTRKAAILIEIYRNNEAKSLLEQSLSIVRETPHNDTDLGYPSREGWMLWSAAAFEKRFLESSEEIKSAPPVFNRWKQLTSLQCNAFQQKRELLESLYHDKHKKDDQSPSFDLDVRRVSGVRFSDARYKQLISATRAVRLSEVAGLPPSVSISGMDTIIASDILAPAAEIHADINYELSFRLSLRIAKSENDNTFRRIWSRYRIAFIPMEEVYALYNIVNDVIDYAMPKVTQDTDPQNKLWITRLRVALEALSRLVLRLPPEYVRNVFYERGLRYYHNANTINHPWLYKVIDNLLFRSWEALPKSLRVNFVFDILKSPLAGLDGFMTSQSIDLHDPAELIINDKGLKPPKRDENTENQWLDIINLVERGLSAGGEARKRASLRFVPLYQWNILYDSESNRIAQVLWDKTYTEPDSLPSNTLLLDWFFLLLPEPEIGLAEERFRKKWFSTNKLEDEKKLNKFLWDLGTSFANLRKEQKPLTLTECEHLNLINLVEEWANFTTSTAEPFLEEDPYYRYYGLLGLAFMLPELSLLSDTPKKIYNKIKSLNQTNIPGYLLFPPLTKFLPDHYEDIVNEMRKGLASDNATISEQAVKSLYNWLIINSEGQLSVPQPTNDLLREIGVIIATRRKSALNHALQVAYWIFSNSSKEQCDLIGNLALDGLHYMTEELSYERDHNYESFDDNVPLLRWRCAYLALAMSNAGYDAEPTIKHWSAMIHEDPLPEVRHAEPPTFASENEICSSQNHFS